MRRWLLESDHFRTLKPSQSLRFCCDVDWFDVVGRAIHSAECHRQSLWHRRMPRLYFGSEIKHSNTLSTSTPSLNRPSAQAAVWGAPSRAHTTGDEGLVTVVTLRMRVGWGPGPMGAGRPHRADIWPTSPSDITGIGLEWNPKNVHGIGFGIAARNGEW